MTIKELGPNFDKDWRNDLNNNFRELSGMQGSVNDAVNKAKTAEQIANEAKIKSDTANDTSNSVQNQLDTIVINGDSSVEAAQARVDTDGNVSISLKSRLDKDFLKLLNMLLAKTNLTNKRVLVENDKDATKTTLESANYAGQDLGKSAPIGVIFHHYTDGTLAQIDNVGEDNTILVLKNAKNPVRRPDKPENFSGTGNYVSLVKQNGDTGANYNLFVLNKDGEFWWSGSDGKGNYNKPVRLTTNKDDSGVPAYIIEAYKKHLNVIRLTNGGSAMLDIKNNGDRVDFIIPSAQASGAYFETQSGGLRFNPASKVTEFIGDFKVGDGANWNYPQYISNGPTENRPTVTRAGQCYFDSTLQKPVWRNGSNNAWIETMSKFVSVPSSATSPGVPGDWSSDGEWLYICYAKNQWKRTSVSSW